VAPHEPPQSTSVSSRSLTPSLQCIPTHAPAPSHTSPPLSEHGVPRVALVLVQLFPVHVGTTQTELAGAQSSVTRHATHWPVASHNVPPVAAQGVRVATGTVPHPAVVHVGALHAAVAAHVVCRPSTQMLSLSQVACAVKTRPLHSAVPVQSSSTRQSSSGSHVSPSASHVGPPQSTSVSSASMIPSVQWLAVHAPLPSHTVPPASEHAVPLAALDVAHTLPSHVGMRQLLPDGGHAVATQTTAASACGCPLSRSSETVPLVHEIISAATTATVRLCFKAAPWRKSRGLRVASTQILCARGRSERHGSEMLHPVMCVPQMAPRESPNRPHQTSANHCAGCPGPHVCRPHLEPLQPIF